MSGPRFDPWVWATIIVLTALILYWVSTLYTVLWRAWRTPPQPPPYDWQHDDRLLDEWARDAEGEVLTVGHLLNWRYK
jgi:hypothetical protein